MREIQPYQIYEQRSYLNIFRFDSDLQPLEIADRVSPAPARGGRVMGYYCGDVELTRVFTERGWLDDAIEEAISDEPPYEQHRDIKAGDTVLLVYGIKESPHFVADIVHATSETEGNLIAEFRPERVA